jgi:hypothetical protein
VQVELRLSGCVAMHILVVASVETASPSLTHARICDEDTVCSWVLIKVRNYEDVKQT